jgi:Ca-activated chloride channel homolog
MRRVRLATVVLAALCGFFCQTPPAVAQDGALSQQQSSISIHVSVNRVNVGVIVTDSRGKFVGGLQRESFHVFDDGVEQPITDFASIDQPAQVLMLIEAGPAVYFLESGHIRASHALLEGLSAGDRIAVVKYDTTPQAVLDFTADKRAAENALTNVRYYMGFGNLNLSRSLLTVLGSLAKMDGKKTIVLLSTGFDTSDPREAAMMLDRLKIADVRILAISLGAELRGPAPKFKEKNQPPREKVAITEKGFADADQLMRELTEATGGRAFFPNSPKDFVEVYGEIAQLVRHEYSLAFAPPRNDGKIHQIEVRVMAPGTASTEEAATKYAVDHRRAYIAPTS